MNGPLAFDENGAAPDGGTSVVLHSEIRNGFTVAGQRILGDSKGVGAANLARRGQSCWAGMT